jgi:hypothetical protein
VTFLLDQLHDFVVVVVEELKNLNDEDHQSNDVYHPIHHHLFFVEKIVDVVVDDQ